MYVQVKLMSVMASQKRWHAYPVVFYKAYVVRFYVNAKSLQAAKVQLLGIARIRLHDDLKLGVTLHPVWVVTISTVIWSD